MSKTPINLAGIGRESLLRQSQIIPSMVPISPATLWRWVKLNQFPQPRKIGLKTTVWVVGEVQDWLEKSASQGTAK